MKNYFLENTVTSETLETDSAHEAMTRFLKTQMPCELWSNGELIAEKEWEENPVTGELVLESMIYEELQEA